MDFTYKAVPTFSKVHRDPYKYKFVMGPVGSGKSSGCVWHLFLHALKQPVQADGVRRSHYAVVRATYPSLKSTTVKTWQDWFKDKITVVFDTPIRAEIKFDLPDGSKLEMKISFLALESELDVQKLRSLEVTGAHINEAAEVDESIFQMLKTRIKRYPSEKDGGCVDPFILCDYNAVSTDHWLYHLAEEVYPSMTSEDKAKHHFYKQPPAVLWDGRRYILNPEADNVIGHGGIDGAREYYEDMCSGNDIDFIKVNVMNQYGEVRTGKPVYKDYDDNYHCTSNELKAMDGVPLIIGMDQGLTPAAIFTQQGPDGQVRVIDEITTQDCSLQEFCNDYLWPKLRNEYGHHVRTDNYVIICDPATRQRSMNDSKAGTDIIKESGLNFRTGKSNVATLRREAVVEFLRKKDGFKLSPKCVKLRKGFITEYKYEEVRAAQSAKFKETPAKNEYSHPHDALQYAMLEYYRPRKKQLKFRAKRYKAASTIGGY